MIPYRWRLLGVLWLFDIAGPLHISGTAVVLPFVQETFNLPRATVAWLLVIYFLSSSVFVLAGAYLGNTIGRRKMVILGVSIDLITLIALFFVPSFWGLVVLRFIGAMGNSLTIANLAPLAVRAFPVSRRGQVLGLISMFLGIGVLVTTVTAGAIADTLGWRYLYLVTAALYALVLAGAVFVVKESAAFAPRPFSFRRFDYLGLAMIMGFLVMLTMGMQRLGTLGFNSVGLGMVALSAAFAAAFVVAELHHHNPLISLGLFRHRGLVSALGAQVGFNMMRAANNVLLPFYFVQGLGWTGAFAGTVMIALNLGQPVVSPVSGILADRIGTAKPVLIAFLAMVVGSASLLALGSSPSTVHIVLSLLVVGASLGLVGPPNMKTIYSVVPPEKFSLAPGILSLAGHGSGTIGSAMAAMLLGLFMSNDDVPVAYHQTMLVLLVGFISLGAILAGSLALRRGVSQISADASPP